MRHPHLYPLPSVINPLAYVYRLRETLVGLARTGARERWEARLRSCEIGCVVENHQLIGPKG